MEIDYTLDQLPERILEDVFALIPKNKELRMVCHTFKNIIDNSGKLMKNKWLKVEKVMKIDSMTINHRFQNLIINDKVLLSKEGINWIHNYPYKDQIKAIKIDCTEYDLFKSAEQIQYIISNYNFLEKFCYFTPNDVWCDEPEWPDEIRLIPNKCSILHTLEMNCNLHDNNSVIDMFSSIPTIKNFIMDLLVCLDFPSDIKWKLEKLIIKEEDFELAGICEDYFKQFLSSQQATLKKLKLTECSFNEFASFIIRNLPNLEDLSLCIHKDEYIDDTFLIKNPRMRRLNIECSELSGIDSTDFIALETILNHYNNVEYLSIASFYRDLIGIQYKLITTKFENLTHLLLESSHNFSFLNVDLPNLKVLVLEQSKNYNRKYDVPIIPSKNLQNINKLTLDLEKIKYVLEVLPKCLQLNELNLNIQELCEIENDRFISSINEILSVVPQLNCLGFELGILKHQKMTTEELMDKISKKSILIKEIKCINYCENVQHDDFWLENSC